mmetsp:Transcript_12167/g.24262  ORF Transcript_12167/g.24262 Transcript_12167/m.24262 type:complete len:121 (-) Transcript_12167:138-500(-)|eukprot:CAMPEP_0181323640 /NCGR_PEP_ID=MMETSP1101-20121128/19905_1 /TAXON_ID=46948 /ORGANISM="Rhodomonas abbreviata, Strain Caron Lab Isolate" /LENGTH=120 /DNA_ID=CAMNT_0023431705 /DNA_START=55 /DNA_END=417 /DNA_ORIENTATION=+
MFELLHLYHIHHFSALNQGIPKPGDLWDNHICPANPTVTNVPIEGCPGDVEFSDVWERFKSHDNVSPMAACVVGVVMKHFEADKHEKMSRQEWVSFLNHAAKDGPTMDRVAESCGQIDTA